MRRDHLDQGGHNVIAVGDVFRDTLKADVHEARAGEAPPARAIRAVCQVQITTARPDDVRLDKYVKYYQTSDTGKALSAIALPRTSIRHRTACIWLDPEW